MNYKSFYPPQPCFSGFNYDNDDNEFDEDKMDEQINSLTEEESINLLYEAGSSLCTSFSDSQKNLLHIRESLKLFKDMRYVKDVSDLYYEKGVFSILCQLLKLHSSYSLDSENMVLLSCLPDYVSNTVEEIVQLSLYILLQMTSNSYLATKYIALSNFIRIFIDNENDLSSISKSCGFYIMSNIIMRMPDTTFMSFTQEICTLLGSKDDYARESGYAKIFKIISDERDDKSLQMSLFYLLHAICFRISELKEQNDLTVFFSNYIIINIIFDPDDGILEKTISFKPEARKEVYYAIYRLCCVFPNISSYIFEEEARVTPFKNYFSSSNPEDVEFTLRFFCLLFTQSPSNEIKMQIVDQIPWEKLMIRLEDRNLSWHYLFFAVVDEMSIDQVFVERFWENQLYGKIFTSFYDLQLDSKKAIGKMFIEILERVPPEICSSFVQNKVLQVLFDLLDYEMDPELTDDILNALHTVNEKLISIEQKDILVNEYTEYDAVSILQDVADCGEKAYLICKELGLDE